MTTLLTILSHDIVFKVLLHEFILFACSLQFYNSTNEEILTNICLRTVAAIHYAFGEPESISENDENT